MEQKPQLKSVFWEAAYGALSAAFLGCSAIGGTLAGMEVALPNLPSEAAVIPAAAGVLASFLSGTCAAEMWRKKYPEHPDENARYARNLVFGLALSATIISGAYGYRIMDNMLNIIEEGSLSPVTAPIPASTPKGLSPQ